MDLSRLPRAPRAEPAAQAYDERSRKDHPALERVGPGTQGGARAAHHSLDQTEVDVVVRGRKRQGVISKMPFVPTNLVRKPAQS